MKWVEDVYEDIADEVIKELDILKQVILEEDDYEGTIIFNNQKGLYCSDI